MRVFDTNYANIEVLEGKSGSGVQINWNGFASEKEYIEVLQIVLDMFNDHGFDYLVLNQLNMKIVTPNALKWIRQHFVDTVSRFVEKVIISKSRDIFGSLPTDEIIESFEESGLPLSVHEDYELFKKEVASL